MTNVSLCYMPAPSHDLLYYEHLYGKEALAKMDWYQQDDGSWKPMPKKHKTRREKSFDLRAAAFGSITAPCPSHGARIERPPDDMALAPCGAWDVGEGVFDERRRTRGNLVFLLNPDVEGVEHALGFQFTPSDSDVEPESEGVFDDGETNQINKSIHAGTT